jgi:prepilin-type N-terminal cleavage/methylation domain-containing protein
MKKSFSLIELLIVIIVVGILYSTIKFKLSNTSLIQAANQVVSYINYTKHLALKDNKMQYYPLNNSVIEMNRSKYWFKQWWQIRFSYNGNNEYFYEIFSDIPYISSTGSDTYNFDGTGRKPSGDTNWAKTYALNPLNHKYLTGSCSDSSSDYPNCNEADEKLNLTKTYGIVKIKYTNFGSSKKLLFDNYGNVYLREGDDGDAGDINPYDKDKRIPLMKTAKITLCKDDNCDKNISICISPKIGNAYLCK